MSKTSYSDKELAEFKQLILDKIRKAEFDIQSMEEQRQDLGQRSHHNESYGDDAKTDQMLLDISGLLEKKQKYLKELQAALLRIENKSYGVDQRSGELIDKKRLKAEPTATHNI